MIKVVPKDAVLLPDFAERKFKGVIYDTYQWSQKLFDGSHTTFEMLKRPDTVQVVCVVDDKVLVLRDEQPHSGQRLSFPGGRVDEADEDITTAAKREVHEETGYEFRQWRLVKVWQPHTKIEWFIHLFVAWDVASVVDAHLDAGEKITVDQLSFDEVKKLVLDNVGYLGEARAVFDDKTGIADVLSMPTFDGIEATR